MTKIWRHALLLVWFQLFLPLIVLARRADVLVCPEYYCPLLASCPRVVVFHDTLMWDRPEYARWWKRLLTINVVIPARHGAHVIAVSDSIRASVSTLLRREPNSVKVIYPIVGMSHGKDHDLSALALYGLQPGYLLHVGVLERRKRIPELVAAYGAARKSDTTWPRLVLVGPRSPIASLDNWNQIVSAIDTHGLTNSVVLLGAVDSAHLTALYGAALAFVFASRAEGFGMPLAEAMAAGVPVVAVESPASREVLGRAGLLVKPNDTDALSTALARIVSDAPLRSQLAKLGRDQAQRYTQASVAGELRKYLEGLFQ